MIDTREELIIALSEAAEIEHGLLVQYLFAAYSFKRRLDEGLTPRQQGMLVDWEEAILEVAREEMVHLASVCSLLSAVGAGPEFGRPNFPQPPNRFYPFHFSLERFGDDSLYRFILAELPRGVEPPAPPQQAGGLGAFNAFAPDPLTYYRVGELYTLILDGFNRIPEKDLFIGSRADKDKEDGWPLVKDRRTAASVIKDIILEGEGAEGNRERSHYSRFVTIRKELDAERVKTPGFDPARLVVTDPQTRQHRDANGQITLIEHEVTRKLAELFNRVYTTMLLLLIQYYTLGGETRAQRLILRKSSTSMMSAAIRPLAELLTEMPISAANPAAKAGPGFEIYYPIRLAPEVRSRWVILKERLITESRACMVLAREAEQFPVLERLKSIGQNLRYIGTNLAREFES